MNHQWFDLICRITEILEFEEWKNRDTVLACVCVLETREREKGVGNHFNTI